jgi:hypothetical protein
VPGNSLHFGDHLQTAALEETRARGSRPEYFRLPSRGGDPHFGFTRSFYYAGEARGYWNLVRIRDRGKLRGVTLVPYDAVSAFIRKKMEEAQ